MTEVADTSIQALKQKRENGTLSTDREKCLYIISEYGPITSKDMEIHLGKSKHTFSGRINELKEDNLIEVTGTEDGHQLLDTCNSSSQETGDSCKSDLQEDEFVSMSEADSSSDGESTEGLFVDDKQSDKPEAGDVIYG